MSGNVLISPELISRLEHAERVGVFTGAGMSAESGVPTFRGEEGIWKKFKPEELANFDAFMRNPGLVWEWYNHRKQLIGGITPNAGHYALAAMESRHRLFSIATQNIDNLHQVSGVAPQDVVELHGNTTYAVCLDCAERYELSWVRQKFEGNGEHAPDCACGGHIKTATVSFGQAMPVDAMRRAEELTMGCDLFLAVGSSLVVWPAAEFPLMAKRNGAALVIINREPTEFDELADLVVRNDIGDALAPFIAH